MKDDLHYQVREIKLPFRPITTLKATRLYEGNGGRYTQDGRCLAGWESSVRITFRRGREGNRMALNNLSPALVSGSRQHLFGKKKTRQALKHDLL